MKPNAPAYSVFFRSDLKALPRMALEHFSKPPSASQGLKQSTHKIAFSMEVLYQYIPFKPSSTLDISLPLRVSA